MTAVLNRLIEPPLYSVAARGITTPTKEIMPHFWRAKRSVAFGASTFLCSAALFLSWLWLSAVTENARKDAGQGGELLANANVYHLGVVPTVAVHIIAPLILVIVGCWATRKAWLGVLIALMIAVFASLTGYLVAKLFFASVNTLP